MCLLFGICCLDDVQTRLPVDRRSHRGRQANHFCIGRVAVNLLAFFADFGALVQEFPGLFFTVSHQSLYEGRVPIQLRLDIKFVKHPDPFYFGRFVFRTHSASSLIQRLLGEAERLLLQHAATDDQIPRAWRRIERSLIYLWKIGWTLPEMLTSRHRKSQTGIVQKDQSTLSTVSDHDLARMHCGLNFLPL
jgi:hypothetical protein